MQKKWVRILIALIIPALFLVIGFFTISDYGITNDEPVHFLRGEAFFHYFVTGKKDYSDLPAPVTTGDAHHLSGIKKSLQERQQSMNVWQHDNHPFEYWMKTAPGGHPPLNDILSALTVEIFYKRLGVLGNVDAHHSIIIISGALCVLAVYLFASEAYGRLAGLVAALSLSLYPFFLVACHNRIKGGMEVAFFTLTIWSFWKGLKDRNWKWVLTSSLFCGFALGTKFNIVFAPFIVLPWLLAFLRSRFIRKERVFSPSLLFSLFLYPLISLFILYACWPWLWPAPVHRLLEVVGYYKKIGTKSGGWDMAVLSQAIFRTPFLVLLLSSIGIGYALTHFWKEKNKTSLLVLLWLLVPIIRGIAPGMTVYGELNQIVEYISPLCILAGVGAKILFLRLRSLLTTRGLIKEALSRYLVVGIILSLFVPHLFILIDLHPNEDMYFNLLIGGIKGARKKGMTYAGMTAGNLFLQGAKWLNEHAEKDARVDIDGLASNIQPHALRNDIEMYRYFSGLEKKGEYLLFRYEDGQINPYTCNGVFPESYLKPVYQVKAQGVPIFNIYKNDAANTYPGMVNYAQLDLKPHWFVTPNNRVEIDLGRKVVPAKIEFIFNEKDCSGLGDGVMTYSADHINWQRDAWNLPGESDDCYKEGRYTHLLTPPKITQFFEIYSNPPDKITCYQKIKDIKIWWLTDFIHLPFAPNFSYSADVVSFTIDIHQSGKYALVSKRRGFSTDFTIGGKKVKVSSSPRALKNGWVVYNEGTNLPSDNHQVKLSLQSTNLIVSLSPEEKDIIASKFSDDLWLVNISNFSIEEMLDSLERLRKL